MVNKSLVRRKAMLLLAGRLTPAMLLALLQEVITLAVSFLQNAAYKAFGVKLATASDLLGNDSIDEYIVQFLSDRTLLLKLTIISAVSGLIAFLISAPLSFGTLRWYRAAVRNEHQPISYALSSYDSMKHIGSALWIRVYVGLHYVKWGALIFAAPLAVSAVGSFLFSDGKEGAAGLMMAINLFLALAAAVLFVFVTSRFFLAPYIYADGGVTVVGAVRESKEKMRGKTGHLLVFMLSLVPIVLLSYIICYGMGSIFITPFASMCFAVYAGELTTDGEPEQNDVEYTVE